MRLLGGKEKMMDLAGKRDLEVSIDKLLTIARDVEVKAKCRQALEALKRNNYDRAAEHFRDAAALHVEEVPVVRLIADAGKAKSFAEARRYIMSGAVKVDGVTLRKHDAKVTALQSVTFRGEDLQK